MSDLTKDAASNNAAPDWSATSGNLSQPASRPGSSGAWDANRTYETVHAPPASKLLLMSTLGIAATAAYLLGHNLLLSSALLIPLVLLLLTEPDWAYYLFIAALPFEIILRGDIVTVPKIAGLVALAAWLLRRLSDRRPLRWNPPMTLMLLFTLWGFTTYAWSLDQPRTLESTSTYTLLALFYFMTINEVTDETRLNGVLTALWVSGVVLALCGLLSLVTDVLSGEERLASVAGNANTYILMGIVTIPGLYWVAVRHRTLVHRIAVAAGAGTLLITSLFTQSRGGLLSLAVFLLVLVVFHRSRTRSLAISLVVVLAIARFAPSQVWRRFEKSGSDIRIVELWPAGWRAFTERPWLGAGLGANASAIAPYLNRYSGSGAVIHNAPLAVAAETGIPGLLLYLGFVAAVLVTFLRAASRLRNKNRTMENVAVVTFAVLIAYLTSWFKGGSMEASKALWVLMGIMSALSLHFGQVCEVRMIEGCTSTHPPDSGVAAQTLTHRPGP